MIIPFFIPHSGCPHQCVFCNQKKITGRNDADGAASVPDTINRYLDGRHKDGPVQVAFYGGTFTALPHETQTRYLETVRPFIRSGKIQGLRLSTRPDAINSETLSILKQYHVRVVELGAQSMDDQVLVRSGRGHTAADTNKAVAALRERGFSVGLQLMPGLPGDSEDIFRRSVQQVIGLKPDFVRLYPALVIKGTPLEGLYRAGRYSPLSLDAAVSTCRDAFLRFQECGVAVARMGLQPTEKLEKPGTILAGPFHPAFRQLVESSVFLDEMRQALRKSEGKIMSAVFLVNPRDVSTAIGQRRANIEILKKEFELRDVVVRGARKTAASCGRIELLTS
jgi:histone acetyltransferase (RNA polymerase elongator complex component)